MKSGSRQWAQSGWRGAGKDVREEWQSVESFGIQRVWLPHLLNEFKFESKFQFSLITE